MIRGVVTIGPAMLQSTLLDDLAPVIGFSATCALAVWYGGRMLYVPSRYYPGHPLARLIGPSALRRLVEEMGSEALKIPAAAGVDQMRRERRACEMFAEGRTTADVAAELAVTVRRAEHSRPLAAFTNIADLTYWLERQDWTRPTPATKPAKTALQPMQT